MEAITWSPGVTLAAIERQVIEKAFAFYRQNKTATAQALGISIRTLENRFAAYAEEDKTSAAWEARRKADRDNQLNRARGISPGRTNPVNAGDGAEAQAGMGVQSAENAAKESNLSMSQRKAVQKVLSEQPARASSGGRR